MLAQSRVSIAIGVADEILEERLDLVAWVVLGA
jgi:hypothetical protein